MSWLTAQLKAAEGLLNAVDKTVSKQIVHLGIVDGEEADGGMQPALQLPQNGQVLAQGHVSSAAAPYTIAAGSPFLADAPSAASTDALVDSFPQHAKLPPVQPDVVPPSSASAASLQQGPVHAPGNGLYDQQAADGSRSEGSFVKLTRASIPFGGPEPSTSTAHGISMDKDPRVHESVAVRASSQAATARHSNSGTGGSSSDHPATPGTSTPAAVQWPSVPDHSQPKTTAAYGLANASDVYAAATPSPSTGFGARLPKDMDTTGRLAYSNVLFDSSPDKGTPNAGAPAADTLPVSIALAEPPGSSTHVPHGAAYKVTGRPTASQPADKSLTMLPSLSLDSQSLSSTANCPLPDSAHACSAGSTGQSLKDPGHAQAGPHANPPSQDGAGPSAAGMAKPSTNTSSPHSPASTAPATTAATSTFSGAAGGGSTGIIAPEAAAAAAKVATKSLASAYNLLSDLLLTDADDGEGASQGSGEGDEASAREVALTKQLDELRRRFNKLRSENASLEDMLADAEERAAAKQTALSQLRSDMEALAGAKSQAELLLQGQLAATKSSLADVTAKADASAQQVALLRGQLAAAESAAKQLMDSRNELEGGMLDALKSELAEAEARLEAERRAHQSTKSTASARERELEQHLASSGEALSQLQHSVDDVGQRQRDLEDELGQLTFERNTLQSQLAAAEAQAAAGRGQGESSEAPATVSALRLEVDSLRSELSAHRRVSQQASGALAAAEAQLRDTGAELEHLKGVLAAKKDTAALESQLRELRDMLYLKQQQYERLASERAAASLRLEREVDTLRSQLARVQGGTAGPLQDGALPALPTSSTAHDMIPMDALGEPYQRLARNNKVGKAVKAAASLLDSTASSLSMLLRQYPLGRLAVLLYLLFIHAYIYYLLGRMQRLAAHVLVDDLAPASIQHESLGVR